MPRRRPEATCPMDRLLRVLTGPWTTYLLWVLTSNGPTRFGELKRRVPGISAKVLTDRLRMLEQAGVIDRAYEETIPPKVTYSLSPRGKELRQVLDALNAIARRWAEQDGEGVDAKTDEASAGRPAAAAE